MEHPKCLPHSHRRLSIVGDHGVGIAERIANVLIEIGRRVLETAAEALKFRKLLFFKTIKYYMGIKNRLQGKPSNIYEY